MLKGVVQTMEEDLLKEKNRHQRSAAKSQQEIRRLKEQVDELKNAEGDLKVREMWSKTIFFVATCFLRYGVSLNRIFFPTLNRFGSAV